MPFIPEMHACSKHHSCRRPLVFGLGPPLFAIFHATISALRLQSYDPSVGWMVRIWMWSELLLLLLLVLVLLLCLRRRRRLLCLRCRRPLLLLLSLLMLRCH